MSSATVPYHRLPIDICTASLASMARGAGVLCEVIIVSKISLAIFAGRMVGGAEMLL